MDTIERMTKKWFQKSGFKNRKNHQNIKCLGESTVYTIIEIEDEKRSENIYGLRRAKSIAKKRKPLRKQ